MEGLKIEIIDGVVTLNKYQEYYPVAERIANELCVKLFGKYVRDNWLVILETTILELVENSKELKAKIVTDISYSFILHTMSSEKIQLPFKEAQAYINGYNNAVTNFNEVFEQVENSVGYSLNKFLPSK